MSPAASDPASRLVCAGCGTLVPAGTTRPYRCPAARAGDDIDHVVTRVLDPTRVAFPRDGADQPFVRYRRLLHSWHEALAGGLSDEDFVAIVERLDRAIAAVDGHGFVPTPFAPAPALGARLEAPATGEVWVKDETGNVAGSHKARHLMGVALHLEVAEAVARRRGRPLERPTLAIASCGNAALAAAVVARAAERRLEVFIPPGAEPAVVTRLERLGAAIAVCPRAPGAPGDPCVHAFRRAVAAGCVPFTCQGSENGLAIEGGQTLGDEMIATLAAAGRTLDRLFVQVGGGALASAVAHAFREAVALGAVARVPRIHAVQTGGAYPLARAWARLEERIAHAPGPDAARAALRYAATHRSQFMWPWEPPPVGLARGILDDETYDWHAVLTAMVESGGSPVVVSEDTLARAHALARATTGLRVCPTGSAGLAGLIDLGGRGGIAPGETVAVLFTGIER